MKSNVAAANSSKRSALCLRALALAQSRGVPRHLAIASNNQTAANAATAVSIPLVPQYTSGPLVATSHALGKASSGAKRRATLAVIRHVPAVAVTERTTPSAGVGT